MSLKWKATLLAKLYQEHIEVPIDDEPIEVLEAVEDSKEEATKSVFKKLHLWHFGEPINSDPGNNFHQYSDVEGFRNCCLEGIEPEIDEINGFVPKWKNLKYISSTLKIAKV
jgi:hypothetical protein